jgi:hypothetical protein
MMVPMRLWEMRRRMEVWTLEGETTGEVGFAVTSWVMIKVYAWRKKA